MGKFPQGKKFSRDGGQRTYGGGQRREFGGDRSGSGRGGGFAPRRDDDRPMFQAVCTVCHRDCEVPFRPSGDKPVFCRECFRKEREGGAPAFPAVRQGAERSDSYRRSDEQVPHANHVPVDQYATQFAQLNNKVDKILHLLERAGVMDVVQNEHTDSKDVHTLSTSSKSPRPTKAAKKTVDAKALKNTLVKVVAKKETLVQMPKKKSAVVKTAAKTVSKQITAKKVSAKKTK